MQLNILFLAAALVGIKFGFSRVAANKPEDDNSLDDSNVVRHQTQLHALQKRALPGRDKCTKRIIGYVPHWMEQTFTIKQGLSLTNVIYSFIDMEQNGRLSLPSLSTSQARLNDVILARKNQQDQGQNFKVSFAIGGGANSQYFSSVLSSSDSRGFLINEIERTITKYQFDGIDVDWEFPTQPQDKENYVTFLRELRNRLGPTRLISIAAASGQWAFGGYDVPNLVKYVDWIGVMSYDFYGAWDSEWGAFVGPNAALRNAGPADSSTTANVDSSIKHYVCEGKDPRKIVMGVPFYGRFWYKTSPPKDARFPQYRMAQRLNNGSYGGDVSYSQLLNEWHIDENSAFKKNWDSQSSTPWAINGDLFLSYDNERSIREKVEYANEHNLGGIMIWAVNQDTSEFTLTNTVFNSGCHKSSDGSISYKCS